MLVLLLVAGDVVGRVVTIAHEGGHMMIGTLTGGSVKDFKLNVKEEGGGTNYNRLPGWLGDVNFGGDPTGPGRRP